MSLRLGLSLISHHVAGGHTIGVPVTYHHNETHITHDLEEFLMGDRKQRKANFLFMGREVEIRPLGRGMVSAPWWKLTLYCLQPKGRLNVIVVSIRLRCCSKLPQAYWRRATLGYYLRSASRKSRVRLSWLRSRRVFLLEAPGSRHLLGIVVAGGGLHVLAHGLFLHYQGHPPSLSSSFLTAPLASLSGGHL